MWTALLSVTVSHFSTFYFGTAGEGAYGPTLDGHWQRPKHASPMTRAQIIQEIQRTAKQNGGKPLGRRKFTTETGIKESDWLGVYWVRDGVMQSVAVPLFGLREIAGPLFRLAQKPHMEASESPIDLSGILALSYGGFKNKWFSIGPWPQESSFPCITISLL
jgi:hypothetical protein